jgi:hypothetical protein
LKGITNAAPSDNQLFATNITLRQVQVQGGSSQSGRNANKVNPNSLKGCQFVGRAPDGNYAHTFVANLQKTAGFSNVQLSSVSMAALQRGVRGGVTITVQFDYENPPAPAPAKGATSQPAAK